jgi:transcriptional regulator with XRE-family HTH domain
MNDFGLKIKALREKRHEPLRIVAFHLNLDQAILSKIENGKKSATREQVLRIAEYFEVSNRDLIVDWLSDKIIYEIKNEQYGYDALKVAEKRVSYLKKKNHD